MKTPAELVQIVDAAMVDATQRSGHWLACHPGCSQCCHGVFAISATDAERLQQGLRTLGRKDPVRAEDVRSRAEDARGRLSATYPGNPISGALSDTLTAVDAFDDFANDEPCPALDPATGTCDLYVHRPLLCRTFGPPLQTEEGGLAVCELCFEGATAVEIDRCQTDPSIAKLLEDAGDADEVPLRTIVAFALQ